MNAPEHFDVLQETDHLQGPHRGPGVHALPHELCSNEQAPPRGPVRPDARFGGTSETFVAGAGI